jgi:hypothetical protein
MVTRARSVLGCSVDLLVRGVHLGKQWHSIALEVLAQNRFGNRKLFHMDRLNIPENLRFT